MCVCVVCGLCVCEGGGMCVRVGVQCMYEVVSSNSISYYMREDCSCVNTAGTSTVQYRLQKL